LRIEEIGMAINGLKSKKVLKEFYKEREKAGISGRLGNKDKEKRKQIKPMARKTKKLIGRTVLIVLLLIFGYFLNPLISPFSSIHDADLDGYSDKRDYYPHDPDFHDGPGDSPLISMRLYDENKSWRIQVMGVSGGDRLPAYDVYLTTTDARGSIVLLNIQLSTMLSGNYYNGLQYVDIGFIGGIEADDYFILEKSIYETHSTLTLYWRDEGKLCVLIISDSFVRFSP